MADFIERCEQEYGMTLGMGTLKTLVGPRGKVKTRFLLREIAGGKTVRASLPDLKDEDTLHPWVLRSVCSRLGVRPSDLGYSDEECGADMTKRTSN